LLQLPRWISKSETRTVDLHRRPGAALGGQARCQGSLNDNGRLRACAEKGQFAGLFVIVGADRRIGWGWLWPALS